MKNQEKAGKASRRLMFDST